MSEQENQEKTIEEIQVREEIKSFLDDNRDILEQEVSRLAPLYEAIKVPFKRLLNTHKINPNNYLDSIEDLVPVDLSSVPLEKHTKLIQILEEYTELISYVHSRFVFFDHCKDYLKSLESFDTDKPFIDIDLRIALRRRSESSITDPLDVLFDNLRTSFNEYMECDEITFRHELLKHLMISF